MVGWGGVTFSLKLLALGVQSLQGEGWRVWPRAAFQREETVLLVPVGIKHRTEQRQSCGWKRK